MNAELAYFDNAATTFPKPEAVYNFADNFYRSSGGNIGRGGNALAVAAGEVSAQAKSNIRRLYNCESKEVVFTSSATDALNRIILGLEYHANDEIFITPFEHNAVTRPINHIAKTFKLNVNMLCFDPNTLTPDLAKIENQFKKAKPHLCVLTHASNVCGTVVPVQDLCNLAKKYGAITVVDMSQTMGLLELELSSETIDFAVFAGHKTLFAPFGIGGFVCGKGVRLSPVYFGGNGIDSVNQEMPKNMVAMQEIGSMNTYAIAGLKASTDWLLLHGMNEVWAKEKQATDELLNALHLYDDIHIIADGMTCQRIGVVSALFDGYSPDEIEMVLGKNGVAVRSGIQCSPYAHRFLGTLPSGTVRFSVSALTTYSDIGALVEVLRSIFG